jgi:hypothetical protein
MVILDGKKSRCIDIRADGMFVFEEMHGNGEWVCDDLFLRQEYEAGRLLLANFRARGASRRREVSFPQSRSELMPQEGLRHDYIMRFVRACLDLPGTSAVLRNAIKKIAKERVAAHDPYLEALGKTATPTISVSTLRRWIKEFREVGHCVAIAAGRRSSGNRRPRVDDLAFRVTHSVIAQHYRKGTKLSVTATKEMAEDVLTTEFERPDISISIGFVRDQIQSLPQRELIKARYGDAVARKLYSPVGGAQVADYPNHIWEIDHTTIDLAVTLPNANFQSSRPTVTTIIDKRTGLFVGFYLGIDDGSQLTVSRAALMAFTPKTEIFERIGLECPADFPVFDAPEIWRCDQAPEFISRHSGVITGWLGTRTERIAGRRPDLKGTIERGLRTLNQKLFHRLRGTTGTGPKDTRRTRPHYETLMTIQATQEVLAEYLFNIYPYERDPVTNRRRIEIYWDSPLSPKIDASPTQSDIRRWLLNEDTRRVERQAVHLHHRSYSSPEFCDYLNLRPERKQSVRVLIEEGNLGRVWVIADEHGRQIPLYSRHFTEDWGVSVQRHLKMYAEAREEGKKTLSPVEERTRHAKFSQRIRDKENKTRKLKLEHARATVSGNSPEITGFIPDLGPAHPPTLADLFGTGSGIEIADGSFEAATADVSEEAAGQARKEFGLDGDNE